MKTSQKIKKIQNFASIAENIVLLNQSIPEDTPPEELDQELLELLWEQEQAFELKAQKIARFIKYTQGEATQIDQEIKRLQQLKKQAQNRENSSKKFLETQMLRVGKTSVNTPLNRIHMRRKSPVLVIQVAEETIPKEFTKTKVEVDKARIKQVLKEDPDSLSWASLVESNQYSVVIK